MGFDRLLGDVKRKSRYLLGENRSGCRYDAVQPTLATNSSIGKSITPDSCAGHDSVCICICNYLLIYYHPPKLAVKPRDILIINKFFIHGPCIWYMYVHKDP